MSARPRELIQRVDSDAKENIFGLSPSARRTIKIGQGIMIALIALGIFASRRDFQAHREAWNEYDRKAAAGGSQRPASATPTLPARSTKGYDPNRIGIFAGKSVLQDYALPGPASRAVRPASGPTWR